MYLHICRDRNRDWRTRDASESEIAIGIVIHKGAIDANDGGIGSKFTEGRLMEASSKRTRFLTWTYRNRSQTGEHKPAGGLAKLNYRVASSTAVLDSMRSRTSPTFACEFSVSATHAARARPPRARQITAVPTSANDAAARAGRAAMMERLWLLLRSRRAIAIKTNSTSIVFIYDTHTRLDSSSRPHKSTKVYIGHYRANEERQRGRGGVGGAARTHLSCGQSADGPRSTAPDENNKVGLAARLNE
ncbi:hypothetical protein EVAR_48546_1 [Eumeta japonica]|uniref:Uncharacterized protein n=1 Tax=Eumeta variegata TaxID=151549 RepID=A0A4C1YAY5_EUMVA|nr:hypothetical protein EVAR_48546_1 [Eumeta japonica]